MEQKNKFLDPFYVETRVKEIKEIRNNQYSYKISRSNRENSKSLYVRFYRVFIYNGEKKFFGDTTLRISDHLLPKSRYPKSQFLVDVEKILCKSRKAQFKKALEQTVKKAKRHDFMHDLSKL